MNIKTKIVDLSNNKATMLYDGILETSTFAKGDSWKENKPTKSDS